MQHSSTAAQTAYVQSSDFVSVSCVKLNKNMEKSPDDLRVKLNYKIQSNK